MVIIEEMNPNGNEFVVDSKNNKSVIDATGKQVIKGGQSTDVGILEAIPICYSLLIYHPLATCFLAVGSLTLVAEYFSTAGPFEYTSNVLVTCAQGANNAATTKNICAISALVVQRGIDYKTIIAKFCLVWFAYVVKPSGRNMVYASILSIVFFLKDVTYLQIMVISQLFFLFVCTRAPFWKLVFLIMGFFVLFTDIMNIGEMGNALQAVQRNLSRKVP